MSRRNNDAEAALGCLVIMVLPFIWLFSWLWDKSKTPLAVQLHQLDRPQFWGETIVNQACPQCQAENEAGRHSCFNCGASLQVKDIAENDKASNEVSFGVQGFFIFLGVVFLIIIFVQLAGSF